MRRAILAVLPGDPPIEQAGMFELVLDPTLAQELGIDIPPSIPLRADRVIA
jgi:hypothetical protein